MLDSTDIPPPVDPLALPLPAAPKPESIPVPEVSVAEEDAYDSFFDDLAD